MMRMRVFGGSDWLGDAERLLQWWVVWGDEVGR
jgi:hypothetical protein